MPSGAVAKRLLLGAGLGLVVLLIVGFIFGAVGSAIFGTDRFLDEPEIHLPPQPVFPASSRADFLGVGEAEDEGGSGAFRGMCGGSFPSVSPGGCSVGSLRSSVDCERPLRSTTAPSFSCQMIATTSPSAWPARVN